MIKILHTGDIHLGDLAGPTKDGANLRREDTLNCMDAIFHKAFLEEPDITIIAGDLFNRSRVWADTALDDVNDALERLIRPLCKVSDAVVLLFGTMNHDNPRAFEVIRKATADLRNLHIYTEPKVERITTRNGTTQIMAVPGFDKGRIRLFCPGVDKETENRNATALINDVVLGLATQLDPALPSVMVAHYTVSGSESESGSTFLAGQDVVILPSTIDAANVSLACFGHIHKPQKLVSNTPAYYCGSPNQLTFNDEGIKHGFWLHEIDPDIKGRVFSTFENTPERQHYTLRLNEAEVASFISTGTFIAPFQVAEAVVRVRYSCTAEQDKAFNRAELQKQLMAAGAFYVAEITPEDIEELDAKDQLTEHDGPAECLARWLEANDITGEKAAALLELAGPIIKQADDGRNDGKHTGAFIPRTVEVKNYRSYTEASFDFEPVHMAMVNGQNGVGKSSLFMDAIADCLYEQTRKEDIGGWVRDGTRSGAITFAFGLGGQEYRVIRTRTKSGRGTLSLQRFDPEAQTWADESDTTMKLTQAKIERLLGMDCNTFCSIALIRQDAYGLFLDASSDRRMEVLSALLGLDIYNRMEEIARAAATDQRRKIAATKERVNVLREQTGEKDVLTAQDAALAQEIESLEGSIRENEAELKAAEQAEALRRELERGAQEKRRLADRYLQESRAKHAKAEDLTRKVEELRKLADGLRAAEICVDILNQAKARLRELTPQLERDAVLGAEMDKLNRAGFEAASRIKNLKAAREVEAGVLARKAEVEAAVEALAALEPKIDAARRRVREWAGIQDDVFNSRVALERHVSSSKVRIGSLEQRLKAAQDEAAKLEDSGCPNPEGATCKFLTSAVAAQAAIPELASTLEAEKAEGRAKYVELSEALEKAQQASKELGDPTAELEALMQEQRRLSGIAGLAAKMAASEARLKALDDAIEEQKAAIEESNKRLAEVAAERNGLLATVHEAESLHVTISDKEPYLQIASDCRAAADSLQTVEPMLKLCEDEEAELIKKHAEAAQEAAEAAARIPGRVDIADTLRARISTYRRNVTEYATQRGQISAKLSAIEEAEQQISGLRVDIERAALTLNDYTTLTQAFGLDGIQYMIIRGVVPEIMRQSNDILAAMTGGRMAVDIRTEREQKSTKQIVNSLEVWINTITGGTRPYQSHSGGEKVKIALAVTLGLADVKARRAGVQLGMLFIDEPPFLDADGTDAYADALVSMAGRNPNMRILAISHDPTMKARFSQNIIVTGGENGSTVEME